MKQHPEGKEKEMGFKNVGLSYFWLHQAQISQLKIAVPIVNFKNNPNILRFYDILK